MKNKYKILSFIFAALLVLSFAGCSSKKEKKVLDVFNWGENIDEGLIKEFENKYDVKINYNTYDTNEFMYQAVKSGKSNYDIVVPSDYMVEKMRKENMLEQLDFKDISNFSKLSSDYLNRPFDPGNKYSVPYMSGTIGILYNSNLIKEPVDSWNILWDTKYKGEIFMLDAQRDAIGVSLKRLGYSLNTTDKAQINQAKEELIKQKPLVKAYVDDEVKDLMISGEGKLAVIWSGEGLNLQDKYPYLKYIVPKEGSNFWIDSLAIPKGAKHKQEAEAFINFLCEKDPSLRNAAEVGYTTPQKEAMEAQDDHIKDNKNAYLPKGILDKCENYRDLGDKLKLYDDAWLDVKTAK